MVISSSRVLRIKARAGEDASLYSEITHGFLRGLHNEEEVREGGEPGEARVRGIRVYIDIALCVIYRSRSGGRGANSIGTDARTARIAGAAGGSTAAGGSGAGSS